MSATNVLLVDDDRLITSTLAQQLGEYGFQVIVEESSEAAIDQCRGNPPDIAILDVRLPSHSGIHIAEWLRDETEIPFIFLSAYADRELVEEAAEKGALGYLVKPVEISQVLAAIEAALARADEIRGLRKSENDLTAALASDRNISIAVGILMERHHMPKEEAFEMMRRQARFARRKLSELASDVVTAADCLNMPH